MNNIHNKRYSSGYIFIFPVLLTLVAFILYPVLYGFYISLFKTNLINRWDFRGLFNYSKIFSSREFYTSLWVTIKFTVMAISGHFIIGLTFASLLNKKKLPFRTLFRSVLILPWFFPEVVIGLLWKWLFNANYGLINFVMQKACLIDAPVEWLSSPSLALGAVIFTVIWKGYPLVLILLLAGMQAIPDELYESASIDGANKFQKFFYVTIPSLRHVLMVSLTLDLIWWFKHFTLPWLMTQGGPVGKTNVVAINIYKTAFEYFRYGEAAAIAVIVFIIVLMISLFSKIMLGEKS